MPVSYAHSTDGLPIYEARGRNLVDVNGDIFDIDGNQVHHFDPTTGDPRLGAADEAPGAAIVQPRLGQQIQFLMTVSRSLPFATPGGTAQIAMAPARVSRNPIDYSTKTGSSVCCVTALPSLSLLTPRMLSI